jgi:hypothetical protein
VIVSVIRAPWRSACAFNARAAHCVYPWTSLGRTFRLANPRARVLTVRTAFLTVVAAGVLDLNVDSEDRLAEAAVDAGSH